MPLGRGEQPGGMGRRGFTGQVWPLASPFLSRGGGRGLPVREEGK
jgi:hypothetical protein